VQYLLSVIHDQHTLGTDEEMAAIDVFNQGLIDDGHWVFAGGLGFPESATVVDDRTDDAIVTDGPFLESKEYLAGLWIWEADDLDAALALAAEASATCNRRIEVRPFDGVLN
jgi:hypothetical protein